MQTQHLKHKKDLRLSMMYSFFFGSLAVVIFMRMSSVQYLSQSKKKYPYHLGRIGSH